MKRPLLTKIALPIELTPQSRIITMSVGQWDKLLAEGYERGWTLLELDDNERPVAAYRKTITSHSE